MRVATLSVVAFALAACNAGLPPDSVRSATGSWMVRDAAKQTSLLYVSNLGSSEVTVYTYLNGGGLLLVGTLKKFSYPTGMCTDKAGNVWIPDAGTGKVYEYAHGGSAPIDTITQSGKSRPYDCSVDPKTGNLAVANQTGGQYPSGNVTVYPKGSRAGVKYYAPQRAQVNFVAYDDGGNLYADGTQVTYGPGLYELRKGHHAFTTLTVTGAQLRSPGAIQWLNPTLFVGDVSDQGAPEAYKMFVYGTVANVLATLPFADTQDTYEFWRRGQRVVVPDHLGNSVRIYSVPKGSLLATLTTRVSLPFGTVVSQSGI